MQPYMPCEVVLDKDRQMSDESLHHQQQQEIWQQAEQALRAARTRPLTEDEISLIGWCGNLDTTKEKKA
jgi:hypothetical protein